MTTQQIIVVTGAYLVALVGVVYFTRPTSGRVGGAFAGGDTAHWTRRDAPDGRSSKRRLIAK